MNTESRTVSFAGYEFATNHLTLVCSHVIDGEWPFQVAHDTDGLVQVVCSHLKHGPGEGHPVGLAHMVDLFDELGIALPTVPPGHYAQRETRGWRVFVMPEELIGVPDDDLDKTR